MMKFHDFSIRFNANGELTLFPVAVDLSEVAAVAPTGTCLRGEDGRLVVGTNIYLRSGATVSVLESQQDVARIVRQAWGLAIDS
jgi:hypothetical protein